MQGTVVRAVRRPNCCFQSGRANRAGPIGLVQPAWVSRAGSAGRSDLEMPPDNAPKGMGIIRREKRENSLAHVDEEPDRLSGTLRIEVRPMPEVPGAPDPALPSKGGHGEALQRANRRIRNRLGAPGEVVPTDSHRAVIALDPTVL